MIKVRQIPISFYRDIRLTIYLNLPYFALMEFIYKWTGNKNQKENISISLVVSIIALWWQMNENLHFNVKKNRCTTKYVAKFCYKCANETFPVLCREMFIDLMTTSCYFLFWIDFYWARFWFVFFSTFFP